MKTPPTGFDALRTIAVSRIYLDNFDHITAYWVGMGMKLAQVALSHGADDLHGTIIEEHIFHMAGAQSPQLQTEADMVKAIREAGRTPVQRNTFYEPIKMLGATPPSEGNRTAVRPKIKGVWRTIWRRHSQWRSVVQSSFSDSYLPLHIGRVILSSMKMTLAEPDIVTRNGKPVSVILRIKEYQELLERAEDATERGLVEARPTATRQLTARWTIL